MRHSLISVGGSQFYLRTDSSFKWLIGLWLADESSESSYIFEPLSLAPDFHLINWSLNTAFCLVDLDRSYTISSDRGDYTQSRLEILCPCYSNLNGNSVHKPIDIFFLIRLFWQAALTQLIQYYHRFQKILSQHPFKRLPIRSELINIHHVMVEVKKHKTAFWITYTSVYFFFFVNPERE